MSKEITTSSLKNLFRFPFRGPDWQGRFLIGVGLTFANYLVPIVPLLFVYGYLLRVMRRTARGEEPALPAWDDWGQLILDGLKAMIVYLVYTLPGILVMMGGMIVYFVFSLFLSLLALPLSFIDGEEGAARIVVALVILVLSFILPFFLMAIMFITMAIGWILQLLGITPLPMALAHFAARERLEAAFRVREWWPMLRANKLGYFIAWTVFIGLWAILSLALMITTYTVFLAPLVYILASPIGFFVLLIAAALFGQTYRESAAILGSAEEGEEAEREEAA